MLDIFFEIVVAIAGAVFFGSVVVAGAALALGCVVFGGCVGWFGWRRRRAGRGRRDRD